MNKAKTAPTIMLIKQPLFIIQNFKNFLKGNTYACYLILDLIINFYYTEWH